MIIHFSWIVLLWNSNPIIYSLVFSSVNFSPQSCWPLWCEICGMCLFYHFCILCSPESGELYLRFHYLQSLLRLMYTVDISVSPTPWPTVVWFTRSHNKREWFWIQQVVRTWMHYLIWWAFIQQVKLHYDPSLEKLCICTMSCILITLHVSCVDLSYHNMSLFALSPILCT